MSVIRYFPEIRSAHLEIFEDFNPSIVYFARKKIDFDDDLLQKRGWAFTKANFLDVVARILRERPSIVELPEPMYFRYSLVTIGITTLVLFIGRLTGYRPLFVSYAIENALAKTPPVRWPKVFSWAWAIPTRLLVAVQVKKLSRIAFGSDGARTALLASCSQADREHVRSISRTFLSLSPWCHCAVHKKEYGLVLFAGVAEKRKGFDVLIDAWRLVKNRVPDARLVVVGAGSLTSLIISESLDGLGIERLGVVGRQDLHSLMSRAAVLVMPSRTIGRSREQIGLPLIEGISHGCNVVTSRETGLADWLCAASQPLLPKDFSASDLAEAIVSSISGNHKAVNIDLLPEISGRVAADHWLTSL